MSYSSAAIRYNRSPLTDEHEQGDDEERDLDAGSYGHGEREVHLQ